MPKGENASHRGMSVRLPTPHSVQSALKRWIARLWITRLRRRLWWTVRMRANKGVCSFEIAQNDAGFFGQLCWCLCIFQYCEEHNVVPSIRATSDTYLDRDRGSNWLDYYFDLYNPMELSEVAGRVRYTKVIHDFLDLGPPIVPRMSIDDGARTVHKYLYPKPHITAMVDDFWRNAGANGPVVGVHLRGTDKISEAPRVSWNHCLRVLEIYLREHQTIAGVFAASDEQAFIDFIKSSVKDVPVYSREDHYRSADGRPVHTSMRESGGYEKGEDALVNALLLAKCATLIRTTSLLSAWASLFNPKLKVILLNKPYRNKLWYPENEILRRRDTEYLPEGML
jgi:Nodulation protein Z (NodZ)